DPVHPGPPVDRARLGERGAADLFGVQAERRALRRVAPGRHRTRHRLADELVAESRVVAELLACLLDGDVDHDCLLLACASPPPSSHGGFVRWLAWRTSSIPGNYPRPRMRWRPTDPTCGCCCGSAAAAWPTSSWRPAGCPRRWPIVRWRKSGTSCAVTARCGAGSRTGSRPCGWAREPASRFRPARGSSSAPTTTARWPRWP